MASKFEKDLGFYERREYKRFSARMLEVDKLVVAGYSGKEIARMLYISVRTVRLYLERSRYYFGARNTVHLAALLVLNGTVSYEDVTKGMSGNLI